MAGNCIDHMVNQVCRVNINASCQRGPDAAIHRAEGQRSGYVERQGGIVLLHPHACGVFEDQKGLVEMLSPAAFVVLVHELFE